MYEIVIYEDKNGKSEIKDYLKKLSVTTNKEDRIKLNKIRMYINLLSKYGFELKEPYIKKIAKDIWELRPLKDRILFASWYNNKFVLLSIFAKQTQKTPKTEIDKAKRLFEDFKEGSTLNE